MIRSRRTKITKAGKQLKQVVAEKSNANAINFQVSKHDKNISDRLISRSSARFKKAKNDKNHSSIYQKQRNQSKSLIAIKRAGWKQQVPRHCQEIDLCRNFRIALFDIALRPEWDKHVLPHKTINTGKKRLPRLKFGSSKFSSYKIELQDKSCSTVMEVIEKHQNRNNQKKSNYATSSHIPLGKSASDRHKFERSFPSNRDQVAENDFIVENMGEKYANEESFEIIPPNEISHCLNEEEKNHSVGTLLMIEHNYAFDKSKSISFKISTVKSAEKTYVNGKKTDESMKTFKNRLFHSVKNEHNYNKEGLHSERDSHLNNTEFAGICRLPSKEKHVINHIECSLSEYGSYLKNKELCDADNQFMESTSTMVQFIKEKHSLNEKGNTMITTFTNTTSTSNEKPSFTLNEPTERLENNLVEFEQKSQEIIGKKPIDRIVDKLGYATNLRSPVPENEDCSLTKNSFVKKPTITSTSSTTKYTANVSSQESSSCILSKNSTRSGTEPIQFSQKPIFNELTASTQLISGTIETKGTVPEVQKTMASKNTGTFMQNELPNPHPFRIIGTRVIEPSEKSDQDSNTIILKRKRRNNIFLENIETKKTEAVDSPTSKNLSSKNKLKASIGDTVVKSSKTSLVEKVIVRLEKGLFKNFICSNDKPTGLKQHLSDMNYKNQVVSVENLDVTTASKIRSIENIFIKENTTGDSINPMNDCYLNKYNVFKASSSIGNVVDQRDITNGGLKLGCENTIVTDYAPMTDDCHAPKEKIDNEQPINGGISQIKITNVVSRNKSYLTSFGDMKIVSKTDGRTEFEKRDLPQTVVAKPTLIDDPVSNYSNNFDLSSNQELIQPANFELKKSTHNRKSNNLKKSKHKLIDTLSRSSSQLEKNLNVCCDLCAPDFLEVYPESNSSNLEDIILQIIKDLDPQSIETTDTNRENNYCCKNSGVETESQTSKPQSRTSRHTVSADDHAYIIDALKVNNTAEESQETYVDPLAVIPTNCTLTNIPAPAENGILANVDEKSEQYNLSRLLSTSEDYKLEHSMQEGVDKQLRNQTVLAQTKISDVKEMNKETKKNTAKEIRNPWYGWSGTTTSVEKMNASCLSEPGKLLDVDLLSNQESKTHSTLTRASSEELPYQNQLRWVHTDHAYVQVEAPNLLEEAVDPLVAEILMQPPTCPISSQNPEFVQNKRMSPNKEENENDVYIVEDNESDQMTMCNHTVASEESTNVVTSEESADIPESMKMKPVICWKCGVASKCERMFGMHFTSLHLDSSVLQCLYCPKEFKHEESDAFEQHYVEHLYEKEKDTRKRTIQGVCKSKNDNLGSYMKVFSKKGFIFCCLECNHQTKSYQAIEVHLQDVHHIPSRKKNIFCDHCGLHFSSGAGKRLHSLCKHRDKMSRCNYCYWLYMGKASYYVHLRTCPVRKIIDDKELPGLQRQVKLDLWWMKTSVDSEDWIFAHDEIMSKQRQIEAKQRLSVAYTT